MGRNHTISHTHTAAAQPHPHPPICVNPQLAYTEINVATSCANTKAHMSKESRPLLEEKVSGPRHKDQRLAEDARLQIHDRVKHPIVHPNGRALEQILGR